jgi:hypothetical protein
MPVHLKHGASRFLSRLFGQLREHFRNLGFESDLCYPSYRQNDHR